MSTHKSILLRLSEDLKNQVATRARTDRRSQAETLRIAIEKYCDDEREPVSAK